MVPKNGPIEGNDLNALTGLLHLLSDVNRMRLFTASAGDQDMPDDQVPTDALIVPTTVVSIPLSENLPAYSDPQSRRAVGFL